MKNDPIQAALDRMDELPPSAPERHKQLAKALGGRSNLVAAKAARIAGEEQAAGLTADLVAAFNRFVEVGAAGDKGCAALTAIARALVKLDLDDHELFRRGMKHVQMEGTWGRSEDMAAELRAVCAMGLANSRDHRKLRALAELLADKEWPARAGAVRALAAVGSDAAALLLRYKALAGDKEPDVVADCLIGLLEVEGAEALPLVETIASSHDAEVSEAAILALGASRRPDAIESLKKRFDAVAAPETKKCILLALAGSRTESALDFVVNLIRTGSSSAAANAIEAMAIHRADPRLRQDVLKAAESREDGASLLRQARF